jgi:tetratricopeptide (TPR) repeat protein
MPFPGHMSGIFYVGGAWIYAHALFASLIGVVCFFVAVGIWTWRWAQKNTLCAALQSLDAREPGLARLEVAVQTFRTALQERTHECVPPRWVALMQSNLGIALVRLAEHQVGTACLEEAVRAFRVALQMRPRERVPLDWAMTQSYLGNALLRLAERETGTARLKEAAKAYRAALQEYTRDRVPLDWAKGPHAVLIRHSRAYTIVRGASV